MNFNYFPDTVNWLGEIEIEDIGNCCIECVTDDLLFYYMLVETRYGSTTILRYGPVLDSTMPIDGCCYVISRYDFDNKKIATDIKAFLNSRVKKQHHTITQARVITRDEFLSKFINPIVFINKDSNPKLELDNDFTGDEEDE